MSDRAETIRPPAIPAPSDSDLAQTARAVRQMKWLLENPKEFAAYIQSLIRAGYIDTGDST